MKKHLHWLYAELREWQVEGLIDQQTATAILARYQATGEKSWGHYLLSSIGIIVFGLGIILFFAYNWADLSKTIKLALVFLFLCASHGTALWLGVRHSAEDNLLQGMHVLGTMMFGAGIFLIAQIYHMNEHYPTAFLLWGAGALLLAWALPSVVQGHIATVLLSIWGFSEIIDFQRQHAVSVLLVAIGILPLAWWQRSTSLLFVATGASLTLLYGNLKLFTSDAILVYVFFATGPLLIASAQSAMRSRFTQSADVLRILGVLVYGTLLFMMTFLGRPGTDRRLLVSEGWPHWLALVVLIVTLVLWLWILYSSVTTGVERTRVAQHALILGTVAVLLAMGLGLFPAGGAAYQIAFNVLLAAQCVLLIIRGTDNLRWYQVTVGVLVLAVLIYVRFNDLFHSLLIRSAVFVVAGTCLFMIGHLYAKRRAQASLPLSPWPPTAATAKTTAKTTALQATPDAT